jgi:hypothetical protein
MVGRGRPMMGADADLQAAADAGDLRAQALCAAMRDCGVPEWRNRQIAPGVQAPCDDLYPLPMQPLAGTPTFISGGPTLITLTARPQKPFRGERPVSLVTRVGAGAAAIVPVIRGAIRVGTDPQAAQIADQPLEFLDRTSFGVRFVMAPAEPGIDITADIQLVGPPLGAGETITVFMSIWGSTWA